ncbi:MAG: BolA family transcriptional regulator [Proteobacteria bacterium]|nr:BolA family transcriptional regulator [Pseudomonadota bacterium]
MTRQGAIEDKLKAALQTTQLWVTNESPNHRAPAGAETHFSAVIVSSLFRGQALVERHRRVYAALGEELQGAVHAWTMKTLTPEEWETTSPEGRRHEPPPCTSGDARAKPVQ